MAKEKTVTMVHILKEWTRRKRKLGINPKTTRRYTWADLIMIGIELLESKLHERN